MVASESVALEGTGHRFERDVAPGEAVFIDLEGQCMRSNVRRTLLNPCIFEYVYLARPDSVMDGISVYQARLNLGETLAKRVISTVPPNEIDVVIPIPESSRPSAMQLAQKLGKPYREGFVKNRYVGRTFIMPGQAVRKKSVRQKLNVHRQRVQGPQRAAGGRLHRARHHLQGDRADGARRRRAQGLHGQRRAAGALPQRLRHRHAHQQRELVAHNRTHRGDPPDHRLRCPDLPGRGRHEAAIGTLNPKLDRASTPRALTASCLAGVRQVWRGDHLCVADRPGAWRAAVRPNTKLLFAETPTNPLTEVCDIARWPTWRTTPARCWRWTTALPRPPAAPLALGADIVMHSGTKYLDGQGRVMAGACAPQKLMVREKFAHHAHAGMTLSPFNAWVVLKGLETLGISACKAQSEQALALARGWRQHPQVARVYYPGLPSPPAARAGHAPAKRPGRRGAVLRRAGRTPRGARNAFHVIDSTQVLFASPPTWATPRPSSPTRPAPRTAA
jgi:hypothetical protein